MSFRLRVVTFSVVVVLLAGCSGPAQVIETVDQASGPAVTLERPIPYPVEPPLPFREAVRHGTRTETGVPGADYWQNSATYDLRATLDVENRRLDGAVDITYANESPYALPGLVLDLAQNLHAEGAARLEQVEVTGGVVIGQVRLNGRSLPEGQEPGHFSVEGTKLFILLPNELTPGQTARLSIDFGFQIPQAGAGERMGYSDDDLFFLAYWYPQMAVFDDVEGWHLEDFLSTAEFYSGFADYTITLDVPQGWLVESTGRLLNPEEVLAPEVLARLRQAEQSDTPVRVVEAETAEQATTTDSDGLLTWRFSAEQVRDVAFSATRAAHWDVARTPVGDLDGNGVTEYTRIGAIWRPSAPRWQNMVAYAQHSIRFLSEYLDFPYPWPHMTAVEGEDIIGGGMEFPMMTLIGPYTASGDAPLYWVTAHELAHMWMPMIVSTNERRFSWLDEGNTTFNENQARQDYFEQDQGEQMDQASYLQLAEAEMEGEIMRPSNYHNTPMAFGTASYAKPATVLVALREVLGEETFLRAFRAYMDRWAYRHPYPWDFFNTFEDVSGRDLDWFWRAWYYETWTLDQAIERVQTTPEGIVITVRDEGNVPMPVKLLVTRTDGTQETHEIPVDEWLTGRRTASITIPRGTGVRSVEIDPSGAFPDINRENNLWRQ